MGFIAQLLDEDELKELSADDLLAIETHLIHHVTNDPAIRQRLRKKIDSIKRQRNIKPERSARTPARPTKVRSVKAKSVKAKRKPK